MSPTTQLICSMYAFQLCLTCPALALPAHMHTDTADDAQISDDIRSFRMDLQELEADLSGARSKITMNLERAVVQYIGDEKIGDWKTTIAADCTAPSCCSSLVTHGKGVEDNKSHKNLKVIGKFPWERPIKFDYGNNVENIGKSISPSVDWAGRAEFHSSMSQERRSSYEQMKAWLESASWLNAEKKQKVIDDCSKEFLDAAKNIRFGLINIAANARNIDAWCEKFPVLGSPLSGIPAAKPSGYMEGTVANLLESVHLQYGTWETQKDNWKAQYTELFKAQAFWDQMKDSPCRTAISDLLDKSQDDQGRGDQFQKMLDSWQKPNDWTVATMQLNQGKESTLTYYKPTGYQSAWGTDNPEWDKVIEFYTN